MKIITIFNYNHYLVNVAKHIELVAHYLYIYMIKPHNKDLYSVIKPSAYNVCI